LPRAARADGDLVAEDTHAREIVWAQPPEQLLAGGPHERQISLHAAAQVQHNDEMDRLRRVVEERQRLQFAALVNFKIFLLQIGHKVIRFVRHRDIDGHRIDRAAKDAGLLWSLRGPQAGGKRGGKHETSH